MVRSSACIEQAHGRDILMEIVAIDQISPDQVILFAWGFVTINATLVYTC
jgi:hypothetical protein